MPPLNQSDFLVFVDGIDGAWATASGGETTSEVRRVWDGGAASPSLTSGKPETSDLVVSRPYRPERDHALYKRLIGKVGKLRSTATKFYTVDGVAQENPVVLEVLLRGVTAPEHDAASAETGRLQTTWAVGEVR